MAITRARQRPQTYPDEPRVRAVGMALAIRGETGPFVNPQEVVLSFGIVVQLPPQGNAPT